MISGGVYENLLFFPAIQLLKDRYPGVQIDVVASARGKQTYELNKNVRWSNVYDPDDYFPEPAEYTDMVGLLKVGSRSSSLQQLALKLNRTIWLVILYYWMYEIIQIFQTIVVRDKQNLNLHQTVIRAVTLSNFLVCRG